MIRRYKNRDPKDESYVGSELVSHKWNILTVHNLNVTFLVLLLRHIRHFVKRYQMLF